MGRPGRTGDHQWSQQHLSHYVEGDLGHRARRRLDRHARDCVDCGRGIRAMRALVYALGGLDGLAGVRAPATIFDRLGTAGAGGPAGRRPRRDPAVAGRAGRGTASAEARVPDAQAGGPRDWSPPPAAPPETEASLIARAQAGDIAAFERLSGAYADRLFMLLLRLLGDRGEAEDVAQEVMLRAWRGIAQFQGRSSYFTWLYRIAVNEANRAWSRRARRPAGVPIGERELQLPTPEADDPSRQAEAQRAAAGPGPGPGRAAARRCAPRSCCAMSRDCPPRRPPRSPGWARPRSRAGCTRPRLRVRAAIGDQALVTVGG